MEDQKTTPASVFFFHVQFRGLLTVAGGVSAAATLLGFLGPLSWFADLFSHFRVQYLTGLIMIGFLFFLLRCWKRAVVFLAFASVDLICILPLWFGKEQAAPDQGTARRVMLSNVNTRSGNPDKVRQVVQRAKPDILVLEEISARWLKELTWLDPLLPYRVTRPRSDNFGIGLFSRFPIVESDIVSVGNAGVPTIVATLDTGKEQLRVIATHPVPPWGSQYSRWRNQQLAGLAELARDVRPLLLIGDLNTTPWNGHFRHLLKQSGLQDSSRGFGVQASWPNSNFLLRIPIDHVLHSPDIAVIERQIGADAGSDHFPLIVDIVVCQR